MFYIMDIIYIPYIVAAYVLMGVFTYGFVLFIDLMGNGVGGGSPPTWTVVLRAAIWPILWVGFFGMIVWAFMAQQLYELKNKRSK